ncbi:hypothetical protein ACJX0J_020985, partial [Zea mays]
FQIEYEGNERILNSRHGEPFNIEYGNCDNYSNPIVHHLAPFYYKFIISEILFEIRNSLIIQWRFFLLIFHLRLLHGKINERDRS